MEELEILDGMIKPIGGLTNAHQYSFFSGENAYNRFYPYLYFSSINIFQDNTMDSDRIYLIKRKDYFDSKKRNLKIISEWKS